MKLHSGIFMTGNPLLLLSVMLELIGVQFISMGLIGELLTRTYFESQGKTPYAVRVHATSMHRCTPGGLSGFFNGERRGILMEFINDISMSLPSHSPANFKARGKSPFRINWIGASSISPWTV